MTNKQILAKIDEVLAVMPTDRTKLEVILRYSSVEGLTEKIIAAVDMLNQLKKELGGTDA